MKTKIPWSLSTAATCITTLIAIVGFYVAVRFLLQ